MGKVRKQRKRLRLESQPTSSTVGGTYSTQFKNTSELLIKPQENLFEGLQIDINSLNKNVSDDVQSMKSYKSVKSEIGRTLSKRDKLKLRREMLMKKFEFVTQQKLRSRKKKAAVSDMNSLRDALPSLESLLKSKGDVQHKEQINKKKGIEKSRKSKKNYLQDVKMFQQIFKSKQFQKNSQEAISQHLKNVLHQEKTN